MVWFTTFSYNIEPDKILLEESRPRYGEDFIVRPVRLSITEGGVTKNQPVHLSNAIVLEVDSNT